MGESELTKFQEPKFNLETDPKTESVASEWGLTMELNEARKTFEIQISGKKSVWDRQELSGVKVKFDPERNVFVITKLTKDGKVYLYEVDKNFNWKRIVT